MVTIDFKLADIKLESSEAYLPKLEKKLSWGFEIIDIFCKKCGFKHLPISQTFLYLQENNNIFLKLHKAQSAVVTLFSCRKMQFKNITNAHMNRFGPP